MFSFLPEFTPRLNPDHDDNIVYNKILSADNIVLNPGSGGATLAADDISSVFYQIIKVAYGALDSATLVSTAAPFPVTLISESLAGNLDVNLAASAITLTVSGTVTANAGTGTLTTAPTATVVDDAPFSPGATPVLMVGATFDDVTPDPVQEGDAGAVRMSINRNLYVQLRDAAGNERGVNIDASNRLSVAVDSMVALAAGGNNIGDVDVASLPALPAGTNNIGDVDVLTLPALPAGTNNIGDVDVLTVPAPLSTAGGGTEATALRVTLANDSTGLVSVDDNGGSLTVDGTVTANAGTGTFITQDASTVVDDAIFNPGSSRVTMVGATFDDAAVDSVNEGDGGALRMSANRNLFINLRDAAGNERGANVDATNRLSVSVDNTPTVTVGTLPNEGQQTMANSISVAIASDQGNLPVSQATASALNAQVVGNVAHDAADSGNPLGVGGTGRTTNPTAVTDGDRVRMFCDDLGKPVVYPIAPRDRIVAAPRVSLTTTTESTLIAAGGVGVFRDLVQLMISSEASTEVRVDIRDVTAGTVMMSYDLAPDGGGVALSLRTPWPQATANSAWTVQLSAAVSTVYISALFVENN